MRAILSGIDAMRLLFVGRKRSLDCLVANARYCVETLESRVLLTGAQLLSITRSSPVGPSTNANVLNFTASFNQPVTGVASSDFKVVTTGSASYAGFSITPVSSSVYTATVNWVTGTGTVALDFIDNGAVRDLNGNKLQTYSPNGLLSTPQYFAAGTLLTAVATGDFNGDGYQDVVALSSNGAPVNPTTSVIELLGNGDGTLQSAQTIYSVTGKLTYLKSADLNGDGISDLVVAGPGYSTAITIMLNTGSGTFTPQNVSVPNGSILGSIAVGDVNGDGRPDLIVSASSATYLLLNNGNGAFGAPSFAAAGGTSLMFLADFNGDGKTDLLTFGGNSGSYTAYLELGNGAGGFTYSGSLSLPNLIAAIADVNNDGHVDLICAGTSGSGYQDFYVYMGNGNGTFQSAIHSQNYWGIFSVPAVADVNGDGYLDLVCAGESNDAPVVFAGSGSGSFTEASAVAPGTSSATVAVADLNQDGRPDVVVASGSQISTVLGTGYLTGQAYSVSPAPASLSNSVLRLSATTIDVNTTATLTLQTEDSGGNNLTSGGLGVTFYQTSGTSGLSIGPVRDNFNGTYTATITGLSTGTPATVTATIGGSAITSALPTLTVMPRVYVVSLSRTSPITTWTTANAVTYTITFSGAVSGVSPSSFVAATTGGVTDTGISVTPISSSVYTVTVNGISGNGTLGVNFIDKGTVTDLRGRPLQSDAIDSFAATRAYPVSFGTQMAVGDVNGDGQPDIIATSLNSGATVLLANGDGTFRQGPSIPVASAAPDIALADVNGDGNLDLISWNSYSTSANVGVALGNGDGTFATAKTYTVGSDVGAVAIADLNGDNKLDIVAISSAGISVLLGNGDGTFRSGQTFSPTPGVDGGTLVLADVNDDGNPDLIVSTTSGLSVFLANGNGTFATTASWKWTSSEPITAVQAIDVNADGHLDLSMDDSYGDWYVALGAGNGTFATPQRTVDNALGSTSMRLADLNGDGIVDALVPAAEVVGQLEATALQGVGDGSFKAISAIPVGGLFALADLNGDSKPDLIEEGGNSIAVQYNDGVGSFDGEPYTIDGPAHASTNLTIVQTSPDSPVDSGSSGIFTATFSNPVTGVAASAFSVVTTGTATDSGFTLSAVSQSVYTITVAGVAGSGTLGVDFADDGTVRDLNGMPMDTTGFAAPQTYSVGTAAAPNASILADVNGDGIPDIVSPNNNGTVSVLLGQGGGKFTAAQTSSVAGPNAADLNVADLNGDGKPDLIYFTGILAGEYDLAEYPGNGDGTFGAEVTIPVPEAPTAIAIADLNGDGRPDLIFTSGGHLDVELGNGDGTFGSLHTFANGLSPGASSLAVSDFNQDGNLDVAMISSFGGVSILLGQGDGTFASPITYSLSQFVTSALEVADLNGDRIPDLIVGSSASSTSILLGKGDGTFTSVPNVAARVLGVADVNGDGKPDLIANGSPIEVLPGNGDATFGSPEPLATLPAGSFPAAVVDLNNDGIPDLIFSSFSNSIVGVALGTGNGTVASPTYIIAQPSKLVFNIQPTGGAPGAGIGTVWVAVDSSAGIVITDNTSSVAVSVNGTAIATAMASNGIAKFSNLVINAPGIYTLVASDGTLTPATSTSFTVGTVTSLSLVSQSNPASSGQTVTFTATLGGYFNMVSGETVTFFDASNSIGTATLNGSGTASFSTSSLSAGIHSITASYPGDNIDLPSVSTPLDQVINAPVAVMSVAINGNLPGFTGAQRSMVDSLVYTFSEAVNLAATGAFTIAIHTGEQGTAPMLAWAAINPDGNGASTQWVVTFTGTSVVGNSIANGVYDITLNPSAVTSEANPTAAITPRATDTFYRLYGDFNGDQVVNATDNLHFKNAITTYDPIFDYDNNGAVNATDNLRFKASISFAFNAAFTTTI
jgi:hypothetical protein